MVNFYKPGRAVTAATSPHTRTALSHRPRLQVPQNPGLRASCATKSASAHERDPTRIASPSRDSSVLRASTSPRRPTTHCTTQEYKLSTNSASTRAAAKRTKTWRLSPSYRRPSRPPNSPGRAKASGQGERRRHRAGAGRLRDLLPFPPLEHVPARLHLVHLPRAGDRRWVQGGGRRSGGARSLRGAP